jgi:hypothetical protein
MNRIINISFHNHDSGGSQDGGRMLIPLALVRNIHVLKHLIIFRNQSPSKFVATRRFKKNRCYLEKRRDLQGDRRSLPSLAALRIRACP